jgi:hypothetical protein
VIDRHFSQPLSNNTRPTGASLRRFELSASDHLAVLARLGTKVTDETSVSPTIALKIVDLCIDKGADALRRRKRVIAKSLIYHRACAFEIKIKDFEAKGFFRSEVIGERALRHLRRFNYGRGRSRPRTRARARLEGPQSVFFRGSAAYPTNESIAKCGAASTRMAANPPTYSISSNLEEVRQRWGARQRSLC